MRCFEGATKRFKLSQLIFITLDRSFRVESIFFTKTRFKRKEKPDLFLYAERFSKEASGTTIITPLECRGRGSNPRPPANGANALPLSHRCSLFSFFYECQYNANHFIHTIPSHYFIYKKDSQRAMSLLDYNFVLKCHLKKQEIFYKGV